MYLSLALLIGLLVLGLERSIGRRAFFPLGAIALMLLLSTAARNRDYRGELSLWADTAAKFPSNARAHNNLGTALGDKMGRPGRNNEAWKRVAAELGMAYHRVRL